MACKPAVPDFISDTATTESDRRRALRDALGGDWRNQQMCRIERNEPATHQRRGWAGWQDTELPERALAGGGNGLAAAAPLGLAATSPPGRVAKKKTSKKAGKKKKKNG
ncbi:MAG TPA: hypothetical protein VHN77_13480 [Phycisphaerales bacterium]|nr:hypothetical protein [Phycisphaerales bacterium]